MSCGELGKGAKTEHTPEPTGWFFTDDPQVVAMPGSGYFPGPTPPNDAINLVPLYAHPDPRVAELEKQRDELLAALESVLNSPLTRIGFTEYMTAKNAIASVKGGAAIFTEYNEDVSNALWRDSNEGGAV